MPPEPMFLIAAFIAGLVRFIWLCKRDGPSFKGKLREALLCFFIVVVLQPIMALCGIPDNLAPVIAVCVGFSGPENAGKLMIERLKLLIKGN